MFPLVMMTSRGVPLISDFPLHEWGCFLGNEKQRDQYCSSEYLAGKVAYALPKLYTADRYSYCTITDFQEGNHPAGIKSMSDWIMVSIYNYGPVIAGFQIYSSFMKFFRGSQKKDIYTAEVFINDIKKGEGATRLGGHAVAIVGWGEETLTVNSLRGTHHDQVLGDS